jgi:hypothetical protein
MCRNETPGLTSPREEKPGVLRPDHVLLEEMVRA